VPSIFGVTQEQVEARVVAKFGADTLPTFIDYDSAAQARRVGMELLKIYKRGTFQVSQLCGFNVITRKEFSPITSHGYLATMELLEEQPMNNLKGKLRGALLPDLETMELITTSSALTVENLVLLYDVRCNWQPEIEMNLVKCAEKFNLDIDDHVGVVFNRMHSFSDQMLKAKLDLASQGVSVVGLYVGQAEAKDRYANEDHEAKKFGVMVERQQLPITKMYGMQPRQYADTPLEVTYYMQKRRHNRYFKKATADAAREALVARLEKLKPD
jgi:hypothetical protein